jgi:D-inositol-3-phosphate glycosyltransferase
LIFIRVESIVSNIQAESCIIVGPAFPLRGGIADFNEALCRAMKQEGIKTSIVSFYLQYPGILFPGKSQITTGESPRDLEIHSLISSINPLSWFRAAAFIKKQKPDFIIIRYWLPFMSPALSTIARRVKKAGIKVIAITDNVIPHEKRPGDQSLTKYFINSCDAFIAMSRTVVDDLKKFTSTKPVTFSPHPIYDIFGNGIPKAVARKKLGIELNKRLILFFGFVRSYKGLDLLLHAMAMDEVRNLNISLLVAGEFYGDEKVYKDLVNELNINERVQFHSLYIPKEEVKNYFCAADLVVQPYRSATQSGITQIAYHFERPMIVTDVGGLSEIVPDGKVGYVVKVDAKDIARRIADFYNQNKEQDFSSATKNEKERFSWKAFVNSLLKLVR